AEAGEFTQRAFLNGKLGLIGVESVIDVINAESREKLKLAKSTSTLSKKIVELYDELKILLSSIYVYIDYPDEDLEDVPKKSLLERLYRLIEDLNLLMQTYRTGRAINEGILTVICGKPNTGKSSLLNRLVGADKAIVTEIPGTTRDIIEETISAGKILLRLCDTAGIRKTDDTVEIIGVNRALKRVDEAELVLIVFDISEELDSDDFELIKKINGNVIAVLNKSDLPAKIDIEYIKNTFPNTVTISAVNGEGIMELLQTIEKMYADGEINYNETAILRNLRQYTSVKSAFDAVSEAVISLETGYTQDVVGLDLEIAMAKLGEIDGRAVSEDIVHEIFSRFCVGK
ncbi:MAG: tRNA uridine-5-carboxymethylaminomethyl(34) synthesis GTPase MnmE, partial [Oscillospiraceae bacterium]|nr:tRNA uridine-5-carboxymethylaminomethyl(34) synthesis GTPase MnmE [Oscillospiraceae bacterium]